jgi:O-antigen/teichoic acid export membrane protein
MTWQARLQSLSRQVRGSRVAQGAAFTLSIRIYGAALAFITQLYLARTMGAEQLGIFVFGWTWLSIAAFLAPAGFDTALVRFLASFQSSRKWDDARGIVRLAYTCTLAAAVTTAALGLLVVHLAGERTAPYTTALVIALATVPVLALVNLHEGIARGFRWIYQVSLPSFALRPTLFLLGVLALAAFGIDASGTRVLAAMTLACVLTLAFQVLRYRASVHPGFASAQASSNTRVWLFNALPMVLVVSFEQLLANTDILMLGVLEGPADTGIYHIAVRIAGIALFVFFAVSAFAAPRIAELHSRNETVELVAFAAKVRLAIGLPTVLGLAVLAFAGPQLLTLFGDQFRDAYYPMMVLCIAVAARALAGPVDNLLTMTGKQNQLARVLAVVALLNLAANALLIPRFGIRGAAFATSGSIVTEMIWVSILAGRHIGFTPWLLRPTKAS